MTLHGSTSGQDRNIVAYFRIVANNMKAISVCSYKSYPQVTRLKDH